jgi:hypothetical protein
MAGLGQAILDGIEGALQLLGFTSGNSAAQGVVAALDDIRTLANVVTYQAKVMVDTFVDNLVGATESVLPATEAGQGVETIGKNLRDIVDWTYVHAIPGSLWRLYRDVVVNLVDPLRAAVAAVKSRVSALEKWRHDIHVWRVTFVDPTLNAWIAWHDWFTTWPRSILYTWKAWFAKPADFAQWATPILWPALLAYVRPPLQPGIRDQLARVVTQSLPDIPVTFDSIALTLLLQDT